MALYGNAENSSVPSPLPPHLLEDQASPGGTLRPGPEPFPAAPEVPAALTFLCDTSRGLKQVLFGELVGPTGFRSNWQLIENAGVGLLPRHVE